MFLNKYLNLKITINYIVRAYLKNFMSQALIACQVL